jgi:intraflagellar transport protein 88
MVAACYRRSGNYQSAFKSYSTTHKKFPENVECLKFLIRLCDDMGLPEGRDYAEKLRKIEKAKELNNQRKDLRTSSRTSKRSAASSSREGSASSNSSGYVTESSRINGRKAIVDSDLMNNKPDFVDDMDDHNERPTTSRRRKALDEDDFEGDEVDAILPE